jgi:hypothetical protein
MDTVGIYNGRWEYLTSIWYILWTFVIYFPCLDMLHVPRIIWQPW